MLTAEEIRRLAADGRLYEFYNSKTWRRIAHKVIRAAHYECQLCKAEHKLSRATVAHHVKHLREFPELAYDERNLMPLCHDCHDKVHERGAYAAPSGYTNDEKW